VSRGGLAQALHRVAQKAEPTYQELVQQIRGSPSVTPDETGWKVGGRLWWMWTFCYENYPLLCRFLLRCECHHVA